MINENLKRDKSGKYTTFPFKDRETYQAFVTTWKAEINALTVSSRENKAKARYLSQTGKPAGERQSLHHVYKRQARDMLQLRADSKVEAQRQWKNQNMLASINTVRTEEPVMIASGR